MIFFRGKLSSNNIKERIVWCTVLMLLIFFSTTILSHYFLAEGALINKNPLQSWQTSDNMLTLFLQIFLFNLLSLIIIALASLFSQKREDEVNYLSVGYTVFFTLIFINGVILGTWSFTVASAAPPLLTRILGVFDILHKAALWEMTGQLLITCSLAQIAIVRDSGKYTMATKFKDMELNKAETISLLLGLLLMIIGALVESIAITGLS